MIRAAGSLVLTLIASATIAIPASSQVLGDDPIIGPSSGAIAFESMDLRGIGLTATVEVGAQRAPGYVPIRLVIAGMGAAAADQSLTFRFATHPGGESPPTNGLVIDVPITIAQGARNTTVTRYLPKWSVGQCMDVSIFADGRVLSDSKLQIGEPLAPKVSVLPQQESGASIRTILPVSELTREQELNWLFISQQDQVTPESMPNLSSVVSDHHLPPAELGVGGPGDSESPSLDQPSLTGQRTLPRDWRGYQSFDAVVMNREGLSRLAQNQIALAPLREWILQGGTVVIYDAESLQQTLNHLRFCATPNPEVEQKILKAIAAREGISARIQQLAGILRLQLRNASPEIDSQNPAIALELSMLTGEQSPDLYDPETSLQYCDHLLESIDRENQINSAQWKSQINIQPVGAGQIVSISAGDRGVGEDQGVPSHADWQIVRGLIKSSSSPMVRQGTEPMLGNDRFRRWMVPGVLQPPVYSFIALLTTFVILVGPVAYLQTSRSGRTHLMFAIAPILAIITTLAMFGYGIVSDGFQTRVRVRQLTWVDGASGDAGERIRATYFAGIRPSAGLQFPGNAEVMRQAEQTGISWEELNSLPPATLGKLTVDEHRQLFDSSFLPSRAQRQFIVHAPRSKLGSLLLLTEPTEQANPQVVSNLAFPLYEVILRDNASRYWRVDGLGAGQTKACEPLDPKSASKLFGKLYNDYRPIAETTNRRKEIRDRRQLIEPLAYVRNRAAINDGVVDGYFETWLQSHLQTSGEIPPSHFVATAAVSEDALAVEDCEVVASIRYLFGTLR